MAYFSPFLARFETGAKSITGTLGEDSLVSLVFFLFLGFGDWFAPSVAVAEADFFNPGPFVVDVQDQLRLRCANIEESKPAAP